MDISIWQFQVQCGKGGSNPALRTLYYRLLRLLSLNIQPLFVFDGPHRPPFKRNAKTNPHTASLPNFSTKQLLKHFGFPFHTAPGEAEAECALLKREGLVDAVLSEDVDTLMFGCGVSLRNWTSEDTRGNTTPTHVNVYEAEATKRGKSGLDRSGMILIALMSGGDYIPAGIPGCGIKIACQAARAGFGTDLCQISRKDQAGLEQWREKLAHELKTNEHEFFRCKHKALEIPETFPDTAVLGYYTHPVVSSSEKVSQILLSITWDSPLDISGLRLFVADAFEWQNLSGAKKFVRGLAPALLVHQLRIRGEADLVDDDDLERKEREESKIISDIYGRRSHFITDATSELRIAYTPADIVGLNLEQENPDDQLITAGSDSEHASCEGENHTTSRSPAKRSTYDPSKSEKIWILETYVKVGVPLMVENWDEAMRIPKQRAVTRARQRAPLGDMKKGAMDSFVKVSKPGTRVAKDPKIVDLPPVFLAPSTAASPKQRPVKKVSAAKPTSKVESRANPLTPIKKPGKLAPQTSSPVTLLSSSPPNNHINPWTLAKRPSDTFNPQLSPRSRYSALGIYGSPEHNHRDETPAQNNTDIELAPSSPSPAPSKPKKHPKSTLESIAETETNKAPPSKSPSPANRITLCTPSPPKQRMPPKSPTYNSQTQPGLTPNPNTTETEARNPFFTSTESPSPLNPPLTTNSTPQTTPSSLPSPSTLFSPILLPPPFKTTPNTQNTPDTPNTTTTGPHPSQPPTKSTLVALRQSLEGAWKTLDKWEADAVRKSGRGRGRGRGRVYKDVSVVDLTESPS